MNRKTFNRLGRTRWCKGVIVFNHLSFFKFKIFNILKDSLRLINSRFSIYCSLSTSRLTSFIRCSRTFFSYPSSLIAPPTISAHCCYSWPVAQSCRWIRVFYRQRWPNMEHKISLLSILQLKSSQRPISTTIQRKP